VFTYQDGRIRVDDRLAEINGISLRGLDNSEAIEILKKAMQTNGHISGFITVTVDRPRTTRGNGEAARDPHSVQYDTRSVVDSPANQNGRKVNFAIESPGLALSQYKNNQLKLSCNDNYESQCSVANNSDINSRPSNSVKASIDNFATDDVSMLSEEACTKKCVISVSEGTLVNNSADCPEHVGFSSSYASNDRSDANSTGQINIDKYILSIFQ